MNTDSYRMTYCVALRLETGLVLLADTRTNAGMDNISRFRKLYVWEKPGERVIAVMTAGNLSVTQNMIARLQERIDNPETPEGGSLMTAPNMFRIAELAGDAMIEVQQKQRAALEAASESFAATAIVAGQVQGGTHRLFLVYAAGNFIEAGQETPFFQIGDHKYGKPILDRVVKSDTSMEDGVKAALVSMDSTLRSNIAVGMPLDLLLIDANKCCVGVRRRIDEHDPQFLRLSNRWSDALREAFVTLPKLEAE